MFQWSDECDKNFFELKTRLTTTLILTLPGGSNGYVVYCDALRVGLGCVFMQQGKAIAYASRQLKVRKKNYMTHDLELVADRFKSSSEKIEFLKDYDMNVLYHLGMENIVVDALNRLSMSSVSAHVEEEKKELAKDVHKLARLEDFLMEMLDDGVIVHNGSESSLVVEVKDKKYSDAILHKLKGAVHRERVEVSFQGGDGMLHY
ncbi:hypothetical protein MTR67_018528 [Solanum verrucosum]|uniref:Reverse transcriptase/retrotransposon-derived protein RNase H-like domain-containing protein n=1 Tax=Solanum verrucosum TaxID=315347 RepID=A0AAF0QMP3_SOLVR|nr:hypothetical protein MTR67_018528 [Solanum verrucosum]